MVVIDYVVFVDTNKKLLPRGDTASVPGYTRLFSKSEIKKALPCTLAVLQEKDNDYRQVDAKVHNLAQFEIVLEEFDNARKAS